MGWVGRDRIGREGSEGRGGKAGMGREGWEGRDGMGRKHNLCECTGENE